MDNLLYLSIFLEETREHLENISKNLLYMEKNQPEERIIHEIFRSTHTIKGMASSMGYKTIAGLTHDMENVLDQVRDGRITITPILMDTLFHSYDIVDKQLQHIEQTGMEFNNNALDMELAMTTLLQSHKIGGSEGKSELVNMMPLSKEVSSSKKKGIHSVRVEIDRLDHLMNLVIELIFIKNHMEGNQQHLSEKMTECIKHLGRVTTDLHDVIIRVRMVPISMVFNRFPRVIRELARETHKEVELSFCGENTDIDRTIVDKLSEPMLHLIRNSVDHGLEGAAERVACGKPPIGNILLSACHDGNHVVIEVIDDGRGIDIERIKQKIVQSKLVDTNKLHMLSDKEIMTYLFHPGFSTADNVSNISGRGVGLDVVKTKIESLGGIVDIESKANSGTKTIIRLPLTLSLLQALLVKVVNETFAIPMDFIVEVDSIEPAKILWFKNQESVVHNGCLIPLIRLEKWLECPHDTVNADDVIPIVIVSKNEKFLAIVVNQIISQQKVIIQSLGEYLSDCNVVSGGTILENGSVALILDIIRLLQECVKQ